MTVLRKTPNNETATEKTPRLHLCESWCKQHSLECAVLNTGPFITNALFSPEFANVLIAEVLIMYVQ